MTVKKHDGCKRSFIRLSKAWYGSVNLRDVPETEVINIGFYHPQGGTSGEFRVTWEVLGGKSTPKLIAYDDGWNALFNFGDLLESMADIDDMDIGPDEFEALLIGLGIEDITKKRMA